MAFTMSDALLPYFGGKRKLCPVIFKKISKYLPREQWQGKVFIDAFLGSGAVSLYAKAQGFKIICNDIAERFYRRKGSNRKQPDLLDHYRYMQAFSA